MLIGMGYEKTQTTSEFVEYDEAINSIRYYRGITLGASCMICHGDPTAEDEGGIWGWETAQTGLDGSGNLMDDKDIGDFHGAFEIIMNLDASDAQVRRDLMTGIILVVIGLGLGGVVLAAVIQRSVIAPVRDVGNELDDSAQQVSSSSGQVSEGGNKLLKGPRGRQLALKKSQQGLKRYRL